MAWSAWSSREMQVVPIPASSGLARLVRKTAAHAPSTASRSAPASGDSGSGARTENGSSARNFAEISSFSTVWTARRLAVSPPACPPIPSQTTYRPRSSLTRKLSSLWSRFMPTSVRAALRKLAMAGTLHRLPPAGIGGLGRRQELAGVLQRYVGAGAREQPRQLADAVVAVHRGDPAVRASFQDLFLDGQVLAREHGDLGKVRDADDLSAPRHGRERATDRVRRGPADSGVHLVEEVGVHRVGPGQHALHCEQH